MNVVEYKSEGSNGRVPGVSCAGIINPRVYSVSATYVPHTNIRALKLNSGQLYALWCCRALKTRLVRYLAAGE